MNKLPNGLLVVNPLDNRKDIKIGDKIKIGFENDFHISKLDGSYAKTKNIASGIKQDTKYSGSMGVKLEDGKKGISGSIGKTTTNTNGNTYTTKGNQYSISLDAIHKDGQKGLEGSYTNTKKEGNGIKFGKDDISHTISKDKTYTIGGGADKDGRKYGNFGYETKDTNTNSIKHGDKEISRSDYTTKGHEVTGGIKKDNNGVTFDGAYSNKNIKG